jgi:hypothetical protein
MALLYSTMATLIMASTIELSKKYLQKMRANLLKTKITFSQRAKGSFDGV